MENKIRINLPFNKEYNDNESVSLMERMSNSYNRTFISFLGRIGCLENGLVYLNSNNMPLSYIKEPFNKNKINSFKKQTHHVENFVPLSTFLIADSLLSDKELISDILKEEKFEDFANVVFIPTVVIKTNFLENEEYYSKGIRYAKSLKKAIWEIKLAWEEMTKETEIKSEDVVNFDKDEFKEFKNRVKNRLWNALEEQLLNKDNVLAGVRNAQEISAEDFYKSWIK